MQKDTELVHGEVKRGTKVICYLKEDQPEIEGEGRLRELIMRHFEVIGLPIEQSVGSPEDAQDGEGPAWRRPWTRRRTA